MTTAARGALSDMSRAEVYELLDALVSALEEANDEIARLRSLLAAWEHAEELDCWIEAQVALGKVGQA